MRRRLTSFGHRRRIRVPLRWTAQAQTITLGTAAIGSAALIIPADYQLSTTLEPSGAVLKRIRMSYIIQCTTVTTTIPATITCGILVQDTNSPAFAQGGYGDPRVAAQLIEQDWLWVRVHSAPDNANADSFTQAQSFIVDVKAQRRLKDHSVFFVMATDTAVGLSANLILKARVLVALKSSG